MINSIAYENSFIHLYSDGYFSSGFFEVDSISLIIGKNGTGKTRILRMIASKIVTPNSLSLDKIFSINFSPDDDEFYGWGCVYFSPVKNSFGERVRKNRYEDASLSIAKKVTIKEVMENEEMFSAFNIHPRLSAVARNPMGNILKNFIDIEIKEVNSSNLRACYFSKFIEFDKLVSFLKDSSSAPIQTQEMHRDEVLLRNALIEKAVNELLSFVSLERLLSFFIVMGNDKEMKNDKWLHDAYIHFINFAKKVNGGGFHYKNKAGIERVELFLAKGSLSFKRSPLEDVAIPLRYPDDMGVLIDSEVDEYFNVELMDMSSGQLAVINQVLSIQRSIDKLARKGISKILLLIDEGDAFLHLEWQQLYIAQLNKFLGQLKRKHSINILQVIIATHSPLLATDLPKKFVCNLDDGNDVDMAFASPMHLLLNKSFSSKNIGEFASSKINSAVENLKNNYQDELDLQVIDAIDNEVLKNEIIRLFGDRIKK